MVWSLDAPRGESIDSPANSFYVLGLTCITLFFSKPVVLLSVLFLAVGDPVAAIVGTLYGRHKIMNKKSWEGTAANYLVCALGTLAVSLFYFHLPWHLSFPLAVVGGGVAAIAELLPFPVNDNFSLPVVSALLLSLVAEIIPFV